MKSWKHCEKQSTVTSGVRAFIFRNNEKKWRFAQFVAIMFFSHHFRRAFPDFDVPARNQYEPRGVFKLNHGPLRRGCPIKHERRILEDLRDCDEGRGRGREGLGIQNRCTAPSGARDGLSSSVACALLSLYRSFFLPSSLPRFALRLLLRNASLQRRAAPAWKNFARERLTVYSQTTATLFTTPHYDA